MDNHYLGEMLRQMNGTVFKNVTKGLTVPGFRKGKAPRDAILRFLQQNNQRQRLFCEIVFTAYFPDLKIDEVDLLTLPNGSDTISGVMAAYALTGKSDDFPFAYDNSTSTLSASENGTYIDKVADSEQTQEDDRIVDYNTVPVNQTAQNNGDFPTVFVDLEENTLLDRDETRSNINELEVRRMTYLGFMSVVQNAYGNTFYNFYPTSTIENNGSIMPMENSERFNVFPTKGNINIRSRAREDAKLSVMFQNGAQYIIDIDDSMIEENVNANGDLNLTNKRIDLSMLQAKNAVHSANEYKLYVVIDYDFAEDLQNNQIIQFSWLDTHDFSGESIILRDGETMVGPFPVVTGNDGSTLYVNPQSKKNNYIFTIYTDNGDSSIYTTPSRESGYITSQNAAYVNLNMLQGVRTDFITDEELVNELCRILDAKENSTESHISNSAFFGLDIPEHILQQRRERLMELFRQQSNLNNMIDSISISVNKLLHNAAITKSERFEETFSALAKNNEFMLSIQKYRIIDNEISERQAELDKLKSDITILQARLGETKQKIESERSSAQNKEIQIKQQELEALQIELDKVTEKYGLANSIDQLQIEKGFQEGILSRIKRDQDEVKNQIDKMIEYFDSHTKDAMANVAQVVIQDRVASVIAEATRHAFISNKGRDNSGLTDKVAYNMSICQRESGYNLVNTLCERVQKYRNYTKNDIINLFICFTQGFLMVLSGAPGTGKTSICSIMAHALGLDTIGKNLPSETQWKGDAAAANRFVFVPVERGWSSKRDFIGYYNPLTKAFDKNNRRVFNALEIMDAEDNIANQLSVPPFIILLDEANLSPMEYYWADFMVACDQQNDLAFIDIGDDVTFRISKSLRFMATINNDHTTEHLSPRLIDRAWTISLPQPSIPMKVSFDEDYDVVSMDSLDKVFNASDADAQSLKTVSREIIKDVFDICRDKLNILISPRTELAIRQYCYTGAKLFDSNNIDAEVIAVDYAIAQKVLSKVQGNGSEYGKQLEELRQVSLRNNLLKSSDILKRLIQIGNSNMHFYQYFA